MLIHSTLQSLHYGNRSVGDYRVPPEIRLSRIDSIGRAGFFRCARDLGRCRIASCNLYPGGHIAVDPGRGSKMHVPLEYVIGKGRGNLHL
jgi:hypothetical protein